MNQLYHSKCYYKCFSFYLNHREAGAKASCTETKASPGKTSTFVLIRQRQVKLPSAFFYHSTTPITSCSECRGPLLKGISVSLQSDSEPDTISEWKKRDEERRRELEERRKKEEAEELRRLREREKEEEEKKRKDRRKKDSDSDSSSSSDEGVDDHPLKKSKKPPPPPIPAPSDSDSPPPSEVRRLPRVSQVGSKDTSD